MTNLESSISESLFDSHTEFTRKPSYVTHNISNVVKRLDNKLASPMMRSADPQQFEHRRGSHRKSTTPSRSPAGKQLDMIKNTFSSPTRANYDTGSSNEINRTPENYRSRSPVKRHSTAFQSTAMMSPIREACEKEEDYDVMMGRFSKSPNKPGVKRTWVGASPMKSTRKSVGIFTPRGVSPGAVYGG